MACFEESLSLSFVRIVGVTMSFFGLFGAACSLLVDSDDLAASSGDASNSTDASDGSPHTANDATGNVDGEQGGDGGGSSTCDATFCESFDQGATTSSLTQWSKFEIRGGGSLELTTAAFRSPPNSLRGRVTSNPMTPAALMFREVASGSRIACEMSLFIVSLPSAVFVDVLSFQTKAPEFDYELWFGFSSSAATFRDDVFRRDGGCDCPLKIVDPPVPASNKWIRVRMETDFKNATLSYDGTIVHSSEFGGGFSPTSPLTVVTGIRGYPDQQAEVLIDDLTCAVR